MKSFVLTMLGLIIYLPSIFHLSSIYEPSTNLRLATVMLAPSFSPIDLSVEPAHARQCSKAFSALLSLNHSLIIPFATIYQQYSTKGHA